MSLWLCCSRQNCLDVFSDIWVTPGCLVFFQKHVLGFPWVPSEFNIADEPSRRPDLRGGDLLELRAVPEIGRLARQHSVAVSADHEAVPRSTYIRDWARDVLGEEFETSSRGSRARSASAASSYGSTASREEVGGHRAEAYPARARPARGRPSGLGRCDLGGGWGARSGRTGS